MTRKVILLFGADGQLGRELANELRSLYDLRCYRRADVDLRDDVSTRQAIRHVAPDVIVNAAAYTAVDRAESDAEVAYAVNAVAPAVMAEEASRTGAMIVHYSTDYVFSGTKDGAYLEDDATEPLSVYGRSKLAGEEAVRQIGGRSVIVRTTWVFGREGTNFLKTILKLAADRDALSVVDDQVGAPTPADWISEQTAAMIRTLESAGPADPRWGTYHVTAAGETSWHGYAQHLVREAAALGARLRLSAGAINPVPSSEYPTAAARPLNSRLSCEKFATTFAVELPDWRVGVGRVLKQLITQ